MTKSCRDLEVWKRAMELVVESYRMAGLLPKTETYGLISQIQREHLLHGELHSSPWAIRQQRLSQGHDGPVMITPQAAAIMCAVASARSGRLPGGQEADLLRRGNRPPLFNLLSSLTVRKGFRFLRDVLSTPHGRRFQGCRPANEDAHHDENENGDQGHCDLEIHSHERLSSNRHATI